MQSRDSLPKAFFWTLASAIGFAVFSGAFKELQPRYPTEQLLFFLMAPILLFACFMLKITKQPFFVKKKAGLLSIRAIAGFFGWACYLYTIPHLPLPIASMCYVSMPLFVILLAPLLIGEHLAKSTLLWISLSFFGILLLIEPSPNKFDLSGLSPEYLLLGFCGALLAALGQIANRRASFSLSSETIICWFALVGTLYSAAFLPSQWQPIMPKDFLLFAALGIGGIITQYTFTQAFRHAPAGIVCTFGFLDEPACIAVGLWFFNEGLNLVQWSGLIMLAIGTSTLSLQRKKKSETSPS